MARPTENQRRNASFVNASVTVSFTASSGKTSVALSPGSYVLTCDQDCYFRQGATGDDATTSYAPLWAKERVEIDVRGDGDDDDFVHAIRMTADGTLWVTQAQ